MKVKKGERVLLVNLKGKKRIVRAQDKIKHIKHLGVIDLHQLIDKQYGSSIQLVSHLYWILPPSLIDEIETLRRKTQIILPKDAALICFYCGIKSGSRVLEAGIGSGALTLALASQVAPNGKVISYEKRKDMLEFAKGNLERADLAEHVSLNLRDVTQGIDERELDATILDIPNPWEVVKHAWKALKVGGCFCAYTPLVSQLEAVVKELRKHSFIEIHSLESLQREMVVGERGTRPSFQMLAHTGYLTFARKVEEGEH
jgi:tRNA (adenine57-N1/adenine58-N1)-methyltransferase